MTTGSGKRSGLRAECLRFVRSRAFWPVVLTSMVLSSLLLAGGFAYHVGALDGIFTRSRSSVVITGGGANTSGPTAYILGAVRQPGVYTLAQDGRVKDLIEAAGGLADDADPVRVNLAEPVADGQQVYVAHLGEDTSALLIGKVNINTATADQLHNALGLSITVARRVVSYRDQHGPYASVSQLLLVPISQSSFDRIKPLVTV